MSWTPRIGYCKVSEGCKLDLRGTWGKEIECDLCFCSCLAFLTTLAIGDLISVNSKLVVLLFLKDYPNSLLSSVSNILENSAF